MKRFLAAMCLGAMAFATQASAAEPAKIHIGICTGTVSQSEDDLRGAEALIKKYGDVANGGMIKHIKMCIRDRVWPAWCSSMRIFMTCSPLLESSAPVGSSARMMSPPFMRARAMLTRCCCPPESSPGLFVRRSPSPRRSRISRARRVRSAWPMPA